jgi:glutaconyl-CoA decarboxylase
MNKLIEDYAAKARPLFCARQGFVDEIVNLPDIRSYVRAFAGAVYQNPKSICPFHQMLLPRTLREFDTFSKS